MGRLVGAGPQQLVRLPHILVTTLHGIAQLGRVLAAIEEPDERILRSLDERETTQTRDTAVRGR